MSTQKFEIIYPEGMEFAAVEETTTSVEQPQPLHQEMSTAEEAVGPCILVGIGVIALASIKYSRARFLNDPQ